MDTNKLLAIRIAYYYALIVISLGAIYVFVAAFGDLFTFSHFIVFSICSLPLAVLAAIFVERAGSSAGNFLMCSFKSPRSRNDEFTADLEKARHSKANGRYEEALELIEGVVASAPDWPDALYLKAQILWAGFGNATGAKRCLTRAMQLVGYDETLHRWASNYFDLIVKADKEKYQQRYE